MVLKSGSAPFRKSSKRPKKDQPRVVVGKVIASVRKARTGRMAGIVVIESANVSVIRVVTEEATSIAIASVKLGIVRIAMIARDATGMMEAVGRHIQGTRIRIDHLANVTDDTPMNCLIRIGMMMTIASLEMVMCPR